MTSKVDSNDDTSFKDQMWTFNRKLTFWADLITLAYQGCASYCLHHSSEDFLGQTEESGPTIYYRFVGIILGREEKREKLHAVVNVMQIALFHNNDKAVALW